MMNRELINSCVIRRINGLEEVLRFTETERDETILYDEGMNDNIIAIGSSFVWLSTGTPTPFSKKLEFEI